MNLRERYWLDSRLQHWLHMRWLRRNALKAHCGALGRSHGGVRNPCLKQPYHHGKHKDGWGDRW